MSGQYIECPDAAALIGRLDQSLSLARSRESSVGLLLIAIDQFDTLLSAHGYEAGDRISNRVRESLLAAIREKDTLIRLGPSKFAVLVEPLPNPGVLQLAATKIQRLAEDAAAATTADSSISLRIGMNRASHNTTDAAKFLQRAQSALVESIQEGTNFVLYSDERPDQAADLLRLDRDVDLALEHKEFEVHYQPKVSTRDFMPCGAEALMRWNHPERGFVSPEVFIPLCDRPGRMEALTAFLLNASMVHASEWSVPLPVSVNITPNMLGSSELVDLVANSLKLWELPPERLLLEVTEGAIISDPETSFAILSQLRDTGVRISIDDFGTGYSSFSYFKNIPADELKIDKSFVMNMFNDDGDRKIVRAVIQLSKEFGLDVTAEGVEDERTAQMLAKFGCDRLQGYFYSRPLPNAGFSTWLQDYPTRAAESG